MKLLQLCYLLGRSASLRWQCLVIHLTWLTGHGQLRLLITLAWDVQRNLVTMPYDSYLTQFGWHWFRPNLVDIGLWHLLLTLTNAIVRTLVQDSQLLFGGRNWHWFMTLFYIDLHTDPWYWWCHSSWTLIYALGPFIGGWHLEIDLWFYDNDLWP